METKVSENKWIVEGTAWIVGNNVNTESITPSRWLHDGRASMMEHIGELLIPEFPKKAQKNDIWVAGTNLGCSSSRNAPLYLKYKGVGAVVCNSASRIFYRNAINSGLPIFDIGPEASKIRKGDRIAVDVKRALITNLTTGDKIQAKPFPELIMAILQAGGINEYIIAHKSQYELLG